MNEAAARALVVLAVLFVSGLVTLAIRNRGSESRRFRQDILDPGVYLFTSRTCSTCDPVREHLLALVGQSGFEEVPWESDPKTFEMLKVDKVPSLLSVATRGRSVLCWGAAALSWTP